MDSFKRVLLKLSGEAIKGSQSMGIDYDCLLSLSAQIKIIQKQGIELGLVVGGGNIFRGCTAPANMQRVRADHMGMLATVINAMAIEEALEHSGVSAHVFSAFAIPSMTDIFNRKQVMEKIQSGTVVIFAGGTGNPYFSTDTCAALRAIEIQADILLKSTKVQGLFDSDPVKNPDARFIKEIPINDFIDKRLSVIDIEAAMLCRKHGMPVRIFSQFEENSIVKVIQGEPLGSLIVPENS